MLSPSQIAATADSIAASQLPSGLILWFDGGHGDPWNHTEAAMALTVAGRTSEAQRAYQWLSDSQHDDGSWCNYYLADGVEEPRRDTNVTAYVAAGVWHHFVATRDHGFLESMFPVVQRALDFVLRFQQPGGEILWAMDPDGTPGRFALLTGSSSIYFSLRCGVAIAEHLGMDQPEWELAAANLGHAVADREHVFEPKERWAMDWYYPVLSGALRGDRGRARLQERWSTFVMDERGVRCVSDRPWVTAAETAECALALDAVGLDREARCLLGWAQALRDDDGSYWTGCVYPENVHFPGGERSTYTSAAVLLDDNALDGTGRTAGFFRGETLPSLSDFPEPASARDR